MNKQKILLLTFLLIFTFSFITAQGCADEGWKGYSKIFENKTITLTCTTCDSINFTAVNANQEVFLDDVSMNKSGSTFSYVFLGTDLDTIGTYQVDGYSNLALPLALCFDVTMTGNKPSIGTYAILILIIIISFVLLLWVSHKFNKERRDKLYDKIVKGYFDNGSGYGKRNLGTVILYTLGYGLLQNLLMFYYLIIIFFLFVVTELVESFSISSLVLLFTMILNVSLWGFILVFIHMLFSFYQLVLSLLKDIGDMYRGIGDGD